jgi:hypothetical protein
MKAITQDRFGSSDVLRLDAVATPAPGGEAAQALTDAEEGHGRGKKVIVI